MSETRSAPTTTSVTRLGLERRAERTIETLQAQQIDCDTIRQALFQAGLRAPRKAETLRRDGARGLRQVLIDTGYDYGDVTSADELEARFREWVQPLVEQSLTELSAARDALFWQEQIRGQTTVEQRLRDPTYRQEAYAAGETISQAWFHSQWLLGAWDAIAGIVAKYRAGTLKPPVRDESQAAPSATRRTLAEQNIVLISAWRKAVPIL
mgnify:CR=1 FL=1